MKRRSFVLGVLGTALAAPEALARQPDGLAEILQQLESDPDLASSARGDRERFQPIPGVPSAAQGLKRARASTLQISSQARSFLVGFEVSGEAAYRKLYTSPVWPGEKSGITIGIGFDLGYATKAGLQLEWGTILNEPTLSALAPACGVKGEDARKLVGGLASVIVGWTQAIQQFDAFLPYAIGDVETTYPNCGKLSADSLGALTSLIYNRGRSIAPGVDRRKEMRQIYMLMRDEKFSDIPEQIRLMKRIWPNNRGLLLRREAEALLFEAGLPPVVVAEGQ